MSENTSSISWAFWQTGVRVERDRIVAIIEGREWSGDASEEDGANLLRMIEGEQA